MGIPRGRVPRHHGTVGSGKTTLLNLLGGVDRPTAARSVAASASMVARGANSPLAGRHVGFIFQFYNLMPMLTAAQNVELPLLLTNLPKDAPRC